MSLREAVKKVLDRLLGFSGYQVLSYHVRKLSGVEPVDLLLSNPLEFYHVLSSLLGRGADFFLEMLLKSLILEAELPSFGVDEAIRELKEGKLDKISRILSRLEEAVES